ncbi:hypothetical protein K432DRAFT_288725 [Lepidopterella palustris CBS 459.81]|uniref:DUF1711-domain-containing protein n=1 Tax=Lepidopterella palustris CBS 459.81 TaxID=1314670 RepID=A0A8E2JJB5_9PEZI|nr:hypothetical protein K432DRAFT_288725 [Lepidopterella palustris CBS 459.81]
MPAKQPKSKIITLQLSPAVLSKFPSAIEPVRKQSQPRSKASSSSISTPVAQVVEPSPSENPSDSNATPLANGTTTTASSLAPPTTVLKRKGIPGPKPGSKRGASNLTPDGLPKPRGKPGPKKKPRLGDLVNDPLAKGPFGAPAPIAQKLGPKANQGAINAGLRALDRTGKPCRKWEKRGFQVKSFTGVTWAVPTWRAPKRAAVDFNGDVKSDTTGSSDTKVKEESSAISEKSNSGGDSSTPNPSQSNVLASSPAPVITVT